MNTTFDADLTFFLAEMKECHAESCTVGVNEEGGDWYPSVACIVCGGSADSRFCGSGCYQLWNNNDELR